MYGICGIKKEPKTILFYYYNTLKRFFGKKAFLSVFYSKNRSKHDMFKQKSKCMACDQKRAQNNILLLGYFERIFWKKQTFLSVFWPKITQKMTYSKKNPKVWHVWNQKRVQNNIFILLGDLERFFLEKTNIFEHFLIKKSLYKCRVPTGLSIPIFYWYTEFSKNRGVKRGVFTPLTILKMGGKRGVFSLKAVYFTVWADHLAPW